MLSCEFGVGVCVWGVGGDSGRDKIQKNIVLFAFSDTLVFNCFSKTYTPRQKARF